MLIKYTTQNLNIAPVSLRQASVLNINNVMIRPSKSSSQGCQNYST